MSEEDLKNMSPEQLAELQKQNCVFCHIVSGKVSSKKIYEDDKCLAILDINPANPGHILLLPKEHYQIMPLVPEDIIGHMFVIAKQLSQIQLKALKAQGTTIMIANGLVAGQRAPHFMIHIIPRKEGDGVGFSYPTSQLKEADRKQLSSTLKKKISSIFKLAGTELIDLDTKPAKIGAKTVEAEFSDVEKLEEQEPQKETEQLSEKPKKAPKKPKPSKKEEVTDSSDNSEPNLDLISRLF